MKKNDIFFIFKRLHEIYNENVELYNTTINNNNDLQTQRIELLNKIEKFENFIDDQKKNLTNIKKLLNIFNKT